VELLVFSCTCSNKLDIPFNMVHSVGQVFSQPAADYKSYYYYDESYLGAEEFKRQVSDETFRRQVSDESHRQLSQWQPDAREEFNKNRSDLRRILEVHLLESGPLPDSTSGAGSSQMQCTVPRQTTAYHGVVISVRGAFGRIACRAVDGEILLHKSDCDQKPKCGDEVTFFLSANDRGYPKAVEAKILPRA